MATHSSGPGLRTSAVQRGTIEQTLPLTGTIEPVDQANVDFPVAGTVKTVNVTLGQHVKAGSVLATLDTATLNAQVDKAESTLLSDESRLISTEDDPPATASDSPASTAGSTTTASQGTRASPAASSQVNAAESNLKSSEDQADQLATTEKADLAQAEEACQTAGVKAPISGPSASSASKGSEGAEASHTTGSKPGALAHSDSYTAATQSFTITPQSSPATVLLASSTPSPGGGPAPTSTTTTTVTTSTPSATIPGTSAPSTTPTTMPGTTATTAPSTTKSSSTGGGAASASQADAQCLTDVERVSATQLSLSDNLQSVSTAESALAGVIGRNGQSTQSNQRQATPATTGSQAGISQARGTSAPSSAATLASETAAADGANADLASAQQSLADSNLLAPTSGTVALLNISADEHVTAGVSSVSSKKSPAAASSAATTGTSSAQVVIISDNAMEVQASLTTTQVTDVKVGNPVTVLAASSTTPIRGSVTQLDLVGDQTASDSVTFPVTIALDNDPRGLRAGEGANVTVITDQVSNVVAVPTSAVHTIGTRHYVEEVDNGKEVPASVDIGAVGDTLTQITSGVKVGGQLVIADLETPLPTAGSTSGAAASFALSGGRGGIRAFRGAAGAGSSGRAGGPAKSTGAG